MFEVKGLGKFDDSDLCFSTKYDMIYKYLKIRQEWDPEIQEAFKKYGDKNMNAIDCGAHIGIHSVCLSKYYQQVYAFEPNPISCLRLTKNLALNDIKNVQVYPIGLSDNEGLTSIAWHLDVNTGDCGLNDNPQGITQYSDIDPTKSTICGFPVYLKTIDDLNLHNIKMMKVDVEGYEYRVIKGAIRTIFREKPIIVIESWKGHGCQVLDINDTSDNVINYIKSLGYKVESIGMTPHKRSSDFICIPNPQ